jgi:hypothetical protein
MKPMRVAIVVGLVGVAGLAAGCGGGTGGGTSSGSSIETKDDDLRLYLGEHGKMYKWELDITNAVCQLEKHSAGIPDTDKYCPGGTPSGTPPPKYPPAQ